MSLICRRTFLALGAAALAVPAAAQPQPKPGDTVVIDGKTVHLAVGDPTWKVLNSAKITTDRKKGVMLAAFPPPLAKLNGRSLTLQGFILPVEASPTFGRFLLTKTNFACGFCPPPAPTETVEVRLARRKVKATLDPVKVQGRLELIGSSEESVFYRLVDARMV
jgi:uncharacterized protein